MKSGFIAAIWAAVAGAVFCLSGLRASAGQIVINEPGIELLIFLAPNADGKSYEGEVLFKDLLKPTDLNFRVAGLPSRHAEHVAEVSTSCAGPASAQWAAVNHFHWIGPIVTSQLSLYQRSQIDRPVTKLRDVAGWKVGVFADGYAHRVLQHEKLNADATPKDELNLLKLEAARIDYWLSFEEFVAEAIVRQNKPMPRLALKLDKVEFGLACNTKLPDSTKARLTRIADRYWHENKGKWPGFP